MCSTSPAAHVDDLFSILADREAERALENVGQLLVLVIVLGTMHPFLRYTCASIMRLPVISLRPRSGDRVSSGDRTSDRS